MNQWILRMVMAFKTLWRRLGADPNQLEAILSIKLTVDDRRPLMAFGQQQKRKRPPRRRSLGTMFVSLFMGAVFLFVFAVSKDYVAGLTLYFLMFMVMLSITLIGDFTNVLIDVRDNYILLPRPVGPKTILLARLLHILIHLSRVVLPMALPGLVYICVDSGALGGLMFAVDVVFATLICIFLINAVYLLILRVTSVERFKDIIGLIQVLFSIVVFALYYIGPRLASTVVLNQHSFLDRPYLYAAPPLWLAALWTVVRHPTGQNQALYWLGAAGLLLAPVSIWVVIRYLAPHFDRKLGALGGGSEGWTRTAPTGPVNRKRVSFGQALSHWLTQSHGEGTGFEIAWLLSGRNRDFKLKVYPSFAYVFLYFFYYGIAGGYGNHGSISVAWKHLPDTRMYILLIYMSSLAVITAITTLVYSEKYKASWVYYVSPLKAPGEVQVGAVKALLVKYFLPFYIGISVFAFFVWGLKVLPDMLLGLANVTWFGMLIGFIYLKKLPFSAAPNTQAETGRFMRSFFIFLIPASVGVVHFVIRYALPDSSWVIWIAFALAVALLWVIYSKYRELSWEELARVNDDF